MLAVLMVMRVMSMQITTLKVKTMVKVRRKLVTIRKKATMGLDPVPAAAMRNDVNNN